MKLETSKRKFILLIVLSFVILGVGIYLLLTRKGQEEGGVEIVSGGEYLWVEEVRFIDEDKKDLSPVQVGYIKIISSGNIYEKEIAVGEDNVNLFILEASYGEKSHTIDVVVGIQYCQDYEEILNWWVYNILEIEEEGIKELGNNLFEEEYLESVFEKGTVWRYGYYSNYSIPMQDSYLKVLEEVMGNVATEEIPERLYIGNTEDLILLPYLIQEVDYEE